jgi:hypothetical protein
MHNPEGLYTVITDLSEVPADLPLIGALTGFADAGGAVSQLNEYLLETLDYSTVVEFDNDILLDYRARRPTIFFDEDHLDEYTPARLGLYLSHDEIGQPFLFLTGYEPDFQWERFTTAVVDLIDKLKVKTTTWVHAIPMPVPHTRPISVTVSGNRAELIETMSIWKPRTQAPANALHLVEYRLQQTGHSIAGFVLLIPHYLGDTEFPSAAVTAIESISAATGLIFPTDNLREAGREFLSKIEGQVENNAELAKLVTTLEERHDSYLQDNPLRSPLTDIDGELPSADSIAAELQNFLAMRRDDDGPAI